MDIQETSYIEIDLQDSSPLNTSTSVINNDIEFAEGIFQGQNEDIYYDIPSVPEFLPLAEAKYPRNILIVTSIPEVKEIFDQFFDSEKVASLPPFFPVISCLLLNQQGPVATAFQLGQHLSSQTESSDFIFHIGQCSFLDEDSLQRSESNHLLLVTHSLQYDSVITDRESMSWSIDPEKPFAEQLGAFEQVDFYWHQKLKTQLEEVLCQNIHSGPILSGSERVGNVHRKHFLKLLFPDALALDQEASVIAQCCRLHKTFIPHTSCQIVLPSQDDSLSLESSKILLNKSIDLLFPAFLKTFF